MNKLVVIVGPTASGKSDLAVFLAKKFNGEIVSADSRQVYEGMDIGTGKITQEEMQGVPHYMLDVADPKERFSVTQYKDMAQRAIEFIHARGKVPFLVGGTGLYVQAVVDNISYPKVAPNEKLRERLEKQTVRELFEFLVKKDPVRAKTIDPLNKRRLIRALEIIESTGEPVPAVDAKPLYDTLLIGIDMPKEKLDERIEKRLRERLKLGMVEEVQRLQSQGVSRERLEELGLEYRWVAHYLQQHADYDQMLGKLLLDIQHYAKRQLTWFKRDERIHWIENSSTRSLQAKAQSLVEEFLSPTKSKTGRTV